MAVVASVHLADMGVAAALRTLLGAPKARSIEGLRHADVGTAAPLTASVLPKPTVGRVGLVAFWEADDAIDRFLSTDPLGARLAEGWHARLEPLRAFGAWPGFPTDISRSRETDYVGPAVVLTLGRLRLTQTIRFVRTSAKAEAGAILSPGFLWGTALARPPFVATCSLWNSTSHVSTYAYGDERTGHPDAIAKDRTKPFHRTSAFIRFRPYAVRGSLTGRNPLAEHAIAI